MFERIPGIASFAWQIPKFVSVTASFYLIRPIYEWIGQTVNLDVIHSYATNADGLLNVLAGIVTPVCWKSD